MIITRFRAGFETGVKSVDHLSKFKWTTLVHLVIYEIKTIAAAQYAAGADVIYQ